MTEKKAIDQIVEDTNAAGPYTIYSAGGLFTQDELATNVLIKEAVWRLSNGKFQLALPQSKEIKELDRSDLEAFIRNDDLLQVINADIVLARFDGLELDSGTVVEFAMAKFLGKPTVILRCDFRRVFFLDTCEPYNLMVKNWPRCTSVHLNSYAIWAGYFAKEQEDDGNSETPQAAMQAELATAQKAVDEIAGEIIAAMEEVLKMGSPYPPEYQELVYEAARFSLGSGFDQMLTSIEVKKIIDRLRLNGTL